MTAIVDLMFSSMRDRDRERLVSCLGMLDGHCEFDLVLVDPSVDMSCDPENESQGKNGMAKVTIPTSVYHVLAEYDWGEGVDIAVSLGFDVFVKVDGMSALSQALYHGSPEVAMTLMKHGVPFDDADLFHCGRYPVGKMKGMLSAFIRSGFPLDDQKRGVSRMMLSALDFGNMGMMRWCLAHGGEDRTTPEHVIRVVRGVSDSSKPDKEKTRRRMVGELLSRGYPTKWKKGSQERDFPNAIAFHAKDFLAWVEDFPAEFATARTTGKEDEEETERLLMGRSFAQKRLLSSVAQNPNLRCDRTV